MDEKYLQGLYSGLGGEGKFGAFNDFKDAMSTDDRYRSQFYQAFGGADKFGQFSDFDSLVKKKDGGGSSVFPTASTTATAPAPTTTSVFAEGGLGTREGLQGAAAPSVGLDAAQQADFAAQGGYVLSPEQGAQVATQIAEAPRDASRDALVDVVHNAFEPQVQQATYAAENIIKLGGAIYGTPDEQQAEVSKLAKNALAEKGYTDAQTFVDQALSTGQIGPLRNVVNNYYGGKIATATKDALGIRSPEQRESHAAVAPGLAGAAEAAFYESDVLGSDEADRLAKIGREAPFEEKVATATAPLKQDKNRVNVLLDQLFARNYAIDNPKVQAEYDQALAGTKPLKNESNPSMSEITPTQFSGLQYFKDNYPELYNTYQLELAKAADPALFAPGAPQALLQRFSIGAPAAGTYNKQNRDYQYMLYVLDKKGVELNAMSTAQHVAELTPKKAAVDAKYGQQLNQLTQQLAATTDLEQRNGITAQIDQVSTEYNQDPVITEFNNVQKNAQSWDVDFNEKYPDYASREREQKVRDILGTNGKLWTEVFDRVKWLGVNTFLGVENMAGIKQTQLGASRFQLRAMRIAEQEAAEQYQPFASQAIQPLYKLNFNNADYQAISDIQDGAGSDGEKAVAIESYLNKNQDRIRYEQNPLAGKRNWTPAAVGNQVADVTTQVIFQAALTAATDGALRGKLPFVATARAAETTAAATGVEQAAAAAAPPGAVAGVQAAEAVATTQAAAATGGAPARVASQFKDKLYHYGSVAGSTYASVYQQAYSSALAAGKSGDEAESYANQISLVNALSEIINPDIEVVKKAASGVRGISTALTAENLTRGAMYKQAGRAFLKGYVSNVVPETVEEVAAAFGEYGVDALHNMNQDEQNNLNNRVEQAITTTMLGMVPFGAGAGFNTARNTSALMREQVYRAGVNPKPVIDEINTLQQNGGLTATDANGRVQMVNTMQRIVADLPTKDNGDPMEDGAKHHYAYNRLQQAYLKQQMDRTNNDDQKAQLARRMADIQERNQAILAAQNNTIAEKENLLSTLGAPGAGVTVDESGAPAEGVITPGAAPGAAYAVGAILETADGEQLHVISNEDGRYNVQFPDGGIEEFSGEEIARDLAPKNVISPTARQQALVEEIPGQPTPPENAAPAAGGQAQTPVPPEESAITVQTPDQVRAPQIISPLNTQNDATEERNEPEGVQPERESGGESGQAGQTGGSNRLQPETALTEEGPVAAMLAPAATEIAAAPDENAHLTEEAVNRINAMSDAALREELLQDPDVTATDLQEFSHGQLVAAYKGVQAAAGQPAAAPVEGTETISRRQQAVRGFTAAKQAWRRAAADLIAAAPGTPEWDAASARSKAAEGALRAAEDAHLAALSAENSHLSARRRATLSVNPIPTGDDARIIANYVEMARIYAGRGIRSLEGFAKKIGEDVNAYMRRAWEIATGAPVPARNEGESNKAYISRLREYEKAETEPSEEKDASRLIRQGAEQSRMGLKGLSAGIDLLRADIAIPREDFNRKLGLNEDDYKTYVAALKWNRDNNPIKKATATRMLTRLRENNPKKVIAAEMSLAATSLRNAERSARLRVRQATRAALAEGKRKGSEQTQALADIKIAARDQTIKNLKDARGQVEQIFRDVADSGLLRGGEFSSADLLEMGRRINSINSDKQIEGLTDLVQRLIDDSSALQTVKSVDKLQSQLRRLLRGDEVVPASLRKKFPHLGNRSLLATLARLDPNKISNPLQLNAILDNVVNALSGKVQKTVDENGQPVKQLTALGFTTEQIQDFISSQQADMTEARAASVNTQWQQTLDELGENFPGIDPSEVLSAGEMEAITRGIATNPDLTAEQRGDQLGTLSNAIDVFNQRVEEGTDPADLNLADIYEQLQTGTQKEVTKKNYDELTSFVTDQQAVMQQVATTPAFDNIAAGAQEKAMFNAVANLDPSGLTGKELNLLKNVQENILLNHDYSGAQHFQMYYEADQDVKQDLVEWAKDQKVKLTGSPFLKNFLGATVKNIATKDMVVALIANNFPEYATKMLKASALGDIKAGHTRAQTQLEHELIAPLRDLRKKYRKSGINSAPSTVNRGMYAFLVQTKQGATPSQQQAQFERQKGIVVDDYNKKLASKDELDHMEGELARQIYQDKYEKVATIDELRDKKGTFLNEGEEKIYDLFVKYYADNVEAFAKLSENLMNKPFQRYDNYTKVQLKRLTTGLNETGFTDATDPAFSATRDGDDPSNSMIDRANYENLDQIARRNDNGSVQYYRVLNYDFDNTQLNSARDMTEDIYTLPARVKSSFAMRHPGMEGTIGYENTELLKENIIGQVRSNLRRQLSPSEGEVSKAFGSLASALNKVAVRLQLYSISQIFKQVADIVPNTFINLGTDAPFLFKAMGKYSGSASSREAFDKLFAQSDIGLRGKSFGSQSWLIPPAQEQIRHTIENLGEQGDLKRPDRLSHLLEVPDTWAAKQAWIAYYAKSLKRQGKIKEFSDVDWEKEGDDINREARDYADNMTSTRLNLNSREAASQFYEHQGGATRLLQVAILPMSSFSMNNWALLYGDLKTLFGSSTLKEELKDHTLGQKLFGDRSVFKDKRKQNALKSIASRILAEYAYQATRAIITMGYKGASSYINSLAGVPPDKQKDESFLWKLHSEVVRNMAFSMLGNITDNAITNLINAISNKTAGTDLIHAYKQNPNSPGSDLGVFSIAGNSLDKWHYYKELFGVNDTQGNPVDVSLPEKVIIAADLVANGLTIAGRLPSDVKNVLDRAAKNIHYSKDYKEEKLIRVGGADQVPNIKIKGRPVDWTDEQLEYYKAQHQYHLQQVKEKKWTEEHKKRDATDKAKRDLEKKYKESLKYKEK